jgi:type IV protein arginine methyltransferase
MASGPGDPENRISTDCPADIREILILSWNHDTAGLKKLLDEPGRASCRDPYTGETPLHAAIRACGFQGKPGTNGNLEKAQETVHELFLAGAIWNDLDSSDETPGDLAWRLGQNELYDLCVAAGVRAELIFGLLDGYEQLSSTGEDEDEPDVGDVDFDANDDAPKLVTVDTNSDLGKANGAAVFRPERTAGEEPAGTQVEYLSSALTYDDGKVVDEAGNAVMMAWEADIMRQSVDALLPDQVSGKRILNIGFGMGIIDKWFADTKPAVHHIVEAHPDVLKRLSQSGPEFGPAWEAQGPVQGAFKVFPGKWQDVCQKLLEDGQVYDAIYFDTFGEEYSQLRHFFTEYVLGMLDGNGRFSFFNGLGADRRVCYDVYTKVAEAHLLDAGFDVDWKVIDVDLRGLNKDGEGEWVGVVRRYWTLDSKSEPLVQPHVS